MPWYDPALAEKDPEKALQLFNELAGSRKLFPAEQAVKSKLEANLTPIATSESKSDSGEGSTWTDRFIKYGVLGIPRAIEYLATTGAEASGNVKESNQVASYQRLINPETRDAEIQKLSDKYKEQMLGGGPVVGVDIPEYEPLSEQQAREALNIYLELQNQAGYAPQDKPSGFFESITNAITNKRNVDPGTATLNALNAERVARGQAGITGADAIITSLAAGMQADPLTYLSGPGGTTTRAAGKTAQAVGSLGKGEKAAKASSLAARAILKSPKAVENAYIVSQVAPALGSDDVETELILAGALGAGRAGLGKFGGRTGKAIDTGIGEVVGISAGQNDEIRKFAMGAQAPRPLRSSTDELDADSIIAAAQRRKLEKDLEAGNVEDPFPTGPGGEETLSPAARRALRDQKPVEDVTVAEMVETVEPAVAPKVSAASPVETLPVDVPVNLGPTRAQQRIAREILSEIETPAAVEEALPAAPQAARRTPRPRTFEPTEINPFMPLDEMAASVRRVIAEQGPLAAYQTPTFQRLRELTFKMDEQARKVKRPSLMPTEISDLVTEVNQARRAQTKAARTLFAEEQEAARIAQGKKQVENLNLDDYTIIPERGINQDVNEVLPKVPPRLGNITAEGVIRENAEGLSSAELELRDQLLGNRETFSRRTGELQRPSSERYGPGTDPVAETSSLDEMDYERIAAPDAGDEDVVDADYEALLNVADEGPQAIAPGQVGGTIAARNKIISTKGGVPTFERRRPYIEVGRGRDPEYADVTKGYDSEQLAGYWFTGDASAKNVKFDQRDIQRVATDILRLTPAEYNYLAALPDRELIRTIGRLNSSKSPRLHEMRDLAKLIFANRKEVRQARRVREVARAKLDKEQRVQAEKAGTVRSSSATQPFADAEKNFAEGISFPEGSELQSIYDLSPKKKDYWVGKRGMRGAEAIADNPQAAKAYLAAEADAALRGETLELTPEEKAVLGFDPDIAGVSDITPARVRRGSPERMQAATSLLNTRRRRLRGEYGPGRPTGLEYSETFGPLEEGILPADMTSSELAEEVAIGGRLGPTEAVAAKYGRIPAQEFGTTWNDPYNPFEPRLRAERDDVGQPASAAAQDPEIEGIRRALLLEKEYDKLNKAALGEAYEPVPAPKNSSKLVDDMRKELMQGLTSGRFGGNREDQTVLEVAFSRTNNPSFWGKNSDSVDRVAEFEDALQLEAQKWGGEAMSDADMLENQSNLNFLRMQRDLNYRNLQSRGQYKKVKDLLKKQLRIKFDRATALLNSPDAPVNASERVAAIRREIEILDAMPLKSNNPRVQTVAKLDFSQYADSDTIPWEEQLDMFDYAAETSVTRGEPSFEERYAPRKRVGFLGD
jgi:hypothetical protein